MPRKLRKRVVVAAFVLGLASMGVLFYQDDARDWYRNVTADDAGLYYPSSRFMAQHVGCLDTFRPAHLPGTSLTSGECDLANGAHIEFRTFATTSEAYAWHDGASGQSGRLEETGASGVGGNWVIRVTGTTDMKVISPIFQSLPS
ncbi:hypothetical protein [Kineosporia babensis]|uniref:Uncharacterized protein n=1 Tax=Kineosporia babensis TaxID=499548 RepID=A0A9X1NNF9_9ACTN|nr:hypothetical protein [Kineosporia babensis]MCD5316356.1 hypothetical protein [Kineosporia babensis]